MAAASARLLDFALRRTIHAPHPLGYHTLAPRAAAHLAHVVAVARKRVADGATAPRRASRGLLVVRLMARVCCGFTALATIPKAPAHNNRAARRARPLLAVGGALRQVHASLGRVRAQTEPCATTGCRTASAAPVLQQAIPPAPLASARLRTVSTAAPTACMDTRHRATASVASRATAPATTAAVLLSTIVPPTPPVAIASVKSSVGSVHRLVGADWGA